MVVRIRLARHGHKYRPFYRIAVADSKRHVQKKFIEHIGTYDPLPNSFGAKKIRLNLPRMKYWLGVGAQPSTTVSRLASKIHVTPPPPWQTRLEADPAVQRAMSALPPQSEPVQRNIRHTVDRVYNDSDRPSPFLPPLPESDLHLFNLSNPVDWPNSTMIHLHGIDPDAPVEKIFHFLQTTLGYQPLNFLVSSRSKPARVEFTVPNQVLQSTLEKFKGKSWKWNGAEAGKADEPITPVVPKEDMAAYEAWKGRMARRAQAKQTAKSAAPKSAPAEFKAPENPRSTAGANNIPANHVLPTKITADLWTRLRDMKKSQVKIQ